MAEENEIENGENNKSQSDLASELNSVLSQISLKMDRISNAAKSQADFVNSIVDSFSKISSFTEDMVDNSNKINEALSDAVEKVHEKFSKKNFDDINEGLDEVSKNAQNAVNSHSESLEKAGKSVKKVGKTSGELNKSYTRSSKTLSSTFTSNSKSLTKFYKSASSTHQELETFTEELKETSEKMNDVASGYFGAIQKYVGTIMKGGMVLISFVASTIGTMLSFAKHAITLPFTIAKAASSMGFKLREMNAQIKEAGEDLKQSFDYESSIGKGIQSLVSRGTGMIKSFLSPSNELVRIFGMGVSGITGMIKFLGENIAAMGQFSEIFGESILKNDDKMKNFIRLVKGLGLSAEDIKYISLDASNNLKDVNVRMAEITVTLSNTSKEFGVDRKRLSKNFMILRKDIVQFGHLSDEEISRTTARLTQMRVKLEDAAAVFKKFSTFEDAANSVAMLSQTFGMNLDAMDIIKAKNPEEIIEMFRNSMLETGRSYQDLNRFEKDIMAQHTGISEQSLSALMNYRDLGLTYEQAKKRMAAEQPEAKQLKAVKKLNSAIKELQKVLKFESPFEAFSKGIMNNMNLSGDLKNVMMSLSSGYEGIYKFALNLDADTWSGLIRPIKMIIEIMSTILKSSGFKDGLVGTLSAAAGFVADIFGATKGDTILSKIETNVRVALGKGGYLYDNKVEKNKFNKVIIDAVSKNRHNIDGIITQKDFTDLQKISDPLKLIRRLNSFKNGLKKNDPQYKMFDKMLEDAATGIVSTYDPSKLKTPGKASDKLPNQKVDPSKLLAASMSGVIDKNKGNVSELFNVSMKIAGAIIKGAITGGTAILMVVNKQIRGFKASPKKPGESDNMIERILGFKPGEFNELSVAINAAFKDFLSSLDKNSGIFTWLLDGIYDVFEVIARVFYSTLKGALFELLGIGGAESSTSELMKERSSSLARPKVSSTLENIKESKAVDEQSYFGEDQSRTDAVDILYAVKKSAETYSGKNSKDLTTLMSSMETRMNTDGFADGELSTFTENLATLQNQLLDKTGAEQGKADASIDKLKKIYSEYEAKKNNKMSSTFHKGKQEASDFADNAALSGGVILGVGTGAGLATGLIGGAEIITAAGMQAAISSAMGVSAAASTGGGLLAGLGAAAVGSPLIAALAVGALGYGLFKGVSWLLDDAETEVKELNDGEIKNGQTSIDSQLRENMSYKTVDLTSVKSNLERKSRMTIANHNAKDQFSDSLKIQRPVSNKLTRAEYTAYIETLRNVKKEIQKPLEIDAKCIINPETRNKISKENVKDGHYRYFFRTDLNQGRYAPSETGAITNAAGADGIDNTPANPFYYSDQSFDRQNG